MKNVLKKIINFIKLWWQGKPSSTRGHGEVFFVSLENERHWTSRTIHNAIIFFKKEWKIVIPITLTILNFMYTYSIKQTTDKTNEKYQSCKIQQDDKNVIAVICLK